MHSNSLLFPPPSLSIVRALVVAFAVALGLAAPLLADFGATRGVVVMTGASEVDLPLQGWVTGSGAVVEVVEPPRFGTWTDGTYVPGDLFWKLGGDRIVFSASENGVSSTHTLVLMAAIPRRELAITEDFETSGGDIGNLSWAQVGDTGSLSLEEAGGNYSLAIDRGTGGGAVQQILPGPPAKGINGVDQIGGKGAVNPDLPDGGGGGGGGSGGSWNTTTPNGQVFTLLDLSGAARVEMRFDPSGDFAQVRAVAEDAVLDCGASCVTTWRDIPLGVDTALGLWFGRDHLLHPSSIHSTLNFAVYPPAPAALQHDRLTGLTDWSPHDLTWEAGARGPADLGTVTLDLLDGWWDQVGRALPAMILAEDFEGGAWDDAWQALGPFEIAPSSVRFGWRGQVEIPDVLLRQDRRAALVDASVRSAEQLRVEMTVALDNPGAADGLTFTLWEAATAVGGATDPSAEHPAAIEMRIDGGIPYIRARIQDDAGGVHDTAWLPAEVGGRLNEEVPVVLHWWKQLDRSVVAATGGLRLRVGDQDAEVLGIQNLEQLVVEHAVGVWNPLQQPGVSGGRSGVTALLVDDLIVSY